MKSRRLQQFSTAENCDNRTKSPLQITCVKTLLQKVNTAPVPVDNGLVQPLTPKQQLDGDNLGEINPLWAAMKIGQSIGKNTGDSDSADNEPEVEEATCREEGDKDNVKNTLHIYFF